ncbi:Permease of the drug/metabolite transporter (DMT) superfamily [Roseibacterium elongatum DSM 19469]|uniref:Permease of the drug/metabolite transporter (DMT) superfamily n=1 Tax=Roseicyclus elongatus DSM 19469 TaxID=1294273 RepID=W8S2M5_9RHOB|nr:DMT family transporter [Roseibacterium elongatum]AHM04427.1 Permease of the drug/metabolite transporter (DMT) superfamily [Roseibacterium elongatum DSM 19469]
MPSPDRPGALNWALITLLGVIWGTAFMGVSLALDGFGPWWVTAGRTTLAAILLGGLAAATGQGVTHLSGGRAWAFSTAIGLGAIALPFSLLSWGLTQVPSAFAGVAMGAVPLLVLPLVAVFSPEEGIGPRRILGVGLGFVGLVILVGPGALDSGTLVGRMACIGAACCYAGGSVLTRRAPPMPPLGFAAATLIIASLALVPLALWQEGVPRMGSAPAMAALIYVALFPTALATFIRIRVITTAGSLFMSLTSYMVPVWAVLFGVTLMNEALPPQLFWALALILIGIGISQSRALSAMRRKS